jgi:REP element-mobilizing transposase RayT
MGHLDYTAFAQRQRPHIHPIGAELFLTYRLAGTVPNDKIRLYNARGEWLRNEVRRISNLPSDSNDLLNKQQLDRLEAFEREWFDKFENILHKSQFGPSWLKQHEIAKTVAHGLQVLDGDAYRLDAYSIMSNHVHTVFQPLLTADELIETCDPFGRLIADTAHPSLARIMQALKGRSAYDCNKILGRRGQFWEHENFDRVIRPGKFNSTVRYVLNNPVKAGLINKWRDWRWNYVRAELEAGF